MAYSEGQLNGAADYRVGIEIVYSGVQDWDAFSGVGGSRFDWIVYLQNPTSYGSWSGNTQYWSATIDGVVSSGTFGIPFDARNTTTRVIASGSTWRPHDAAGHRYGFPSSAYVDTDHSNIGDGGSGDAWVDAPRIPRVPAAPNSLAIKPNTTTTNSFGVTYQRGDAMGAGIEQDQAQWATDPSFTNVAWNDFGPNTLTQPSGAGVKLLPGTLYYVRIRSRNVRGWGPWSGTVSARTLSGFYTWNGSTWRPTEVLYWSGTAWRIGEVYVYQSGSWRAAA